MVFQLRIHCECGCNANITPKRSTSKDEEGRIYEDYSSITDGMVDNVLFSATIQPDTVNIECKKCGRKHDLTI